MRSRDRKQGPGKVEGEATHPPRPPPLSFSALLLLGAVVCPLSRCGDVGDAPLGALSDHLEPFRLAGACTAFAARKRRSAPLFSVVESLRRFGLLATVKMSGSGGVLVLVGAWVPLPSVAYLWCVYLIFKRLAGANSRS